MILSLRCAGEGWLYLAIVLDLYSRRIIGWAVSDRMKKDLALTTLKRAIANLSVGFVKSSRAPVEVIGAPMRAAD